MKKLFSIIFFLTISLGYHCFAQNFDLKYYSSIQDGDYTSNYKGYSYAEYIGIASEINEDKIDKEISNFGLICANNGIDVNSKMQDLQILLYNAPSLSVCPSLYSYI